MHTSACAYVFVWVWLLDPKLSPGSLRFALQGDWFWLPVPQDERGFIPAKKVQQFHDGRVELEMEDGNVCVHPSAQ